MSDPPAEQLVEKFFRHESANLVSVLTRIFGFPLINVVEDMVQEAMLEALHAWRIQGVPDNPAGWLHRVARNRILDTLRRERSLSSKLESLAHQQNSSEGPRVAGLSIEPDEFPDSLLRMMFACCHPSLDRESRLALTLKVLCGLSDREIASGLLSTPAAIKKRVTRAKRHLQLHQISMELPPTSEISQRMGTVHDVLYLMFNEGYYSTGGDQPLRIDICEEAARLCHLLAEHPLGKPSTRALLALMLYHAARFEARLDEQGQLILLEDQDRSLWDRDMMRVADYWLTRSAAGQEISRFHLEAGIARIHCQAESLGETDWPSIVRHYDLLLNHFPSPLYRLNRAIALDQAGESKRALAELKDLQQSDSLDNYPMLHCSLADLLHRQNERSAAVQCWKTALAMLNSDHERELILQRIRDAESHSAG